MGKYNWQKKEWPHFRYNMAVIQEILIAITEKSGYISGQLAHLDKSQQTEALINLIVEEAIKTSEIEGEFINRLDVRSSIKNKLGLNAEKVLIHDKRAQGVVELMFDVRDTFMEPLTEKKLFQWHEMLMAETSNKKINIGFWRTHEEPMLIVSGRPGKVVVHFEAPPSTLVPIEMKQFLDWFNDTAPGQTNAIIFAPIRAAIAHLYFESIHPFEDGNGRIGRAIAEKALSQGFGYPVMLSLSQAIEANKKAYYAALHAASLSNEITSWISYFATTIFAAQNEIETEINFILKKSIFYDRFGTTFNERQLKVVNRMMKAGIKGFEGGMTAKKYMAITQTSKATATRDLKELELIQAFKKIGKGRSVHYEINWD